MLAMISGDRDELVEGTAFFFNAPGWIRELSSLGMSLTYAAVTQSFVFIAIAKTGQGVCGIHICNVYDEERLQGLPRGR